MARLSKTHQFAIHEDIPTPDPASLEPLDDAVIALDKAKALFEEVKDDAKRIANNDENVGGSEDVDKLEDNVNDNGRRISTLSLSSLPESAYEGNNDVEDCSQQAQTTPVVRPSLRQIEAIQRMQIMSAPHIGKTSPRRSIAKGIRIKTRSPRYIGAFSAGGSPRRRKRISELTEGPDEERQHYPLVLLHASLLPVDLPWSNESMQEMLPATTLENLRLLKSQVSETVLSRGILIQHPQHDFELLEEKLLEALELRDERVTKCGHFHSRDSLNSQSDSDSGIGSSDDGSEGKVCSTCQCHIKDAGVAIGQGSKKWSVRIFAANGLMRASAWAAAWSDMESIDVEIMPWISEDMRRNVDAAMNREQAEKVIEQREDEAERIRQLVEEHVQCALSELKSHSTGETLSQQDVAIQDFALADLETPNEPIHTPSRSSTPSSSPRDLPDIYRPSQIPLSILLKNYICLLAQDRNAVMSVFLMLVVIVGCMRTITSALRTDPSQQQSQLTFEPPPASLPPQSELTILESIARQDESIAVAMLNGTDPSSSALPAEPAIEDVKNLGGICNVDQILSDPATLFVHGMCGAELR